MELSFVRFRNNKGQSQRRHLPCASKIANSSITTKNYLSYSIRDMVKDMQGSYPQMVSIYLLPHSFLARKSFSCTVVAD